MTANHPARPRARPAIPVQVVGAPPEPPAHLSAEAKEQWRLIVREWAVGADALPVLRAALEAWDLAQQAREQVARQGLTIETGSGMIRTNPAVKVQLDAINAYRQALKQLGLEPGTQGG
jgi:P27 family predicted phage terminase small subunit